MSVGQPSRRQMIVRGAGLGVAVWAAPSVVTTARVAAATGSCVSGVTVCEFDTGLDGWIIDNAFGPGIDGLWNRSTDRDSGALHYGRGLTRDYRTGNHRNNGAVTSQDYDLPSAGPLTVTFTIWREVEQWSHDGFDVLRFSILGTASNGLLWSAGSDGGTNGSFETIAVSIPSSFFGDTVQFRFDFDTVDRHFNGFEGIYVGRVTIPACLSPAAALGPVAKSNGGNFPGPHSVGSR